MPFNFTIRKKPKFPIKSFALASLAALVLTPALLFAANSIIKNKIMPITEVEKFDDSLFDGGDPFITRVPSLKDFLKKPIVNGADPFLGPDTAPINIVFFSDFSCSFCRQQEKVFQDILKKYEGKIKLVWKDFPSDNPGDPSFAAALAGRCAQDQEQFWPYHNLLYQESHNLTTQTFLKLAQELSLNERKFKKCLGEEETAVRVYSNMEEANALEIYGIPFIYINDKGFLGQMSTDELETVIKAELK